MKTLAYFGVILVLLACRPDAPAVDPTETVRVDVRTSLSDHGLAETADRLFELVNELREESGLSPMTFHPILGDAALRHAEDMVRRDYFSHKSQEGLELGDRLKPGLSAAYVGENIWKASELPPTDSVALAEKILISWSASQQQRANLLKPKLVYQAIAVSGAEDDLKAVQVVAALP